MTDDPVCHESAIAATCHTDTRGIYRRIFLQYLICEFHQILIINRTVLTTDIRKAVTSAIASTRIHKKHKISLICPHLHFMIIDLAIHRLRSAMNIQNCRIGFLWINPPWLQHPAIQLHSILCEIAWYAWTNILLRVKFLIESG